MSRYSGAPERADKTVRLDIRWVYGALVVLALLAVGAIGLVVGGGGSFDRWTKAPTAVAGLPAGGGTRVPVDPTVLAARTQRPQPAARLTLNVPTSIDGAPIMKAVVHGKPPMSIEQMPVSDGEPRLWLPELAGQNWELPLGDVAPTGPVERDVVIENIGKAKLVLSEAGGGCGCTAVRMESKEVEPGETTVLRVKYDPRVSKDNGKQIRKQIWVASNDPFVPTAEFYITANVLSE